MAIIDVLFRRILNHFFPSREVIHPLEPSEPDTDPVAELRGRATDLIHAMREMLTVATDRTSIFEPSGVNDVIAELDQAVARLAPPSGRLFEEDEIGENILYLHASGMSRDLKVLLLGVDEAEDRHAEELAAALAGIFAPVQEPRS